MIHRYATATAASRRPLAALAVVFALAVVAGLGADTARAQLPDAQLSIDYFAAINQFDINGSTEWVNAPGVPFSQSLTNPAIADVLQVNIDPGIYGDYLAGTGRAGITTGLGAVSTSTLPDTDFNIRRSTSEITASTIRRYTATSDSGSPIMVDLNMFADGVLGYELTGADLGQPQFFNDHWLTASMELEVVVHRDNGTSQSVWYGNGGLFNINYVDQPLQTLGDLDASHFALQQDATSRSATLNLAEVFQDEFTVADGEEFGVEFMLTAKSQNYERYNWTAFADLLNTATLDVQTDDAGGKVIETTPGVPDGNINPPIDDPSAVYTYLYLETAGGADEYINELGMGGQGPFGVFALADHPSSESNAPSANPQLARASVDLFNIFAIPPLYLDSNPAAAGVGSLAQVYAEEDGHGDHAIVVAEAVAPYTVTRPTNFSGPAVQDAPIDFDISLHGRLEVGGLPDSLPPDVTEPIAWASIDALARVYSDNQGWVTLFEGGLLFDGTTLTRLGDFLNAEFDDELANIVELGNGGYIEFTLPMLFTAPITVDQDDLMSMQLRFVSEAFVADGYKNVYAISDFYDSFEVGFTSQAPDVAFAPIGHIIPTPAAGAMGLLLLAGLASRRRVR